MRSVRGLGFLGVSGLLWLGVDTPLAQAVEDRLQIVNMWESGFTGFAKPGELGDGASGPGLDHLAGSLDRGAAPGGPLLSDRTVRWANESMARAYGALHVRAEVKPGGEATAQWDNVRWDGKTGERSVLVVAPSGRGRPQELYHVVLKGTGPLRHFIPYAPSGNGRKLATVRYPLVVSQAEQPTTYKAILVWREPPEQPGRPGKSRTDALSGLCACLWTIGKSPVGGEHGKLVALGVGSYRNTEVRAAGSRNVSHNRMVA